MSALKTVVADGLTDQGLSVDEEHGNLVARGGQSDHFVSFWIDETDRVIRAEEVLCYPVDDFSPELSRALDVLNFRRYGVTFSYQEAKRALVATTNWTSPSRNPTPNQLHLLVALLHEAYDRDGEMLQRIAEGEASADDFVFEDGPPAPGRAARRVVARETMRFQDHAPGSTRYIGRKLEEPPGWVEPPTRPLTKIGEDEWSLDAPDDEPSRRGGGVHGMSPEAQQDRGARSNERTQDLSDVLPPREEAPRTSRLAFQMAIQQAEQRAPERVDLTKSTGKRVGAFFKLIGWLGFVALLVWAAVNVLQPMYPWLFDPRTYLGEPAPELSEGAKDLAAREAMQPGAALLALELESPIEGHSFVQPCLDALGEQARGALETHIVQGVTAAMRERAYNLWAEQGYRDVEGARLRLLRQLQTLERPNPDVVGFVISDLKRKPPTDAAMFEALEWIQGDAWDLLIQLLGHGGDGAAERAAALAKQLPRDNDQCVVLKALIETGQPPADALARLVDKRGVEWTRTGEGRELCDTLVRQDPGSVAGLLASESDDRRLLAVDLLTEVPTEASIDELVRLMRDKQRTLRVRVRAAIGLGAIASPRAAWPLVILIHGRDEEEALKSEALRALQKIPSAGVIAALAEHLESDKRNERYYAVKGLASRGTPSAVSAMIDVVQKDGDPTIRRLAITSLLEMQKEADLRASLDAGLAAFRNLARRDNDPQVRESARKLYRSLTGREP